MILREGNFRAIATGSSQNYYKIGFQARKRRRDFDDAIC